MRSLSILPASVSELGFQPRYAAVFSVTSLWLPQLKTGWWAEGPMTSQLPEGVQGRHCVLIVFCCACCYT